MRFDSEISLSEGDNYVLIIDTNLYSGNFEREMCGYCTGILDYERVHGGKEAKDAEKDNPEMVQSIQDISVSVNHSKYGYVKNAICMTLDGDKDFGAYNSVAVFFSEPLNNEQMQYVTGRAQKYAENYNVAQTEDRKMILKDVYMVKLVVKTLESRITI